MKRQKMRRMILIMALLLFPITMWYFSPYLIIEGAKNGIINGSFIVFCALFIFSIFFGRLFCSYLCPMGGLQECLMQVNDKKPKQGWKNYIKYVIWFLWIAAIIFCFINQKKTIAVNFFYQTDHGISISNIYCYIIYYGIILLIFLPAVLCGKRVFCHYFCWIGPFMIWGTKLRRVLHLPGLHIEAEQSKCISCHLCERKCPMGLDVTDMVKKDKMYSAECIQCGECIDVCPKHVLKYSMKCEKKHKS